MRARKSSFVPSRGKPPQGDAAREVHRKQVKDRKHHDCAVVCPRPVAATLPRGNAIVAVVKLGAAAKTRAVNPFARGAKAGMAAFEQALDRGMDPESWVRQSLQEGVAGSAPLGRSGRHRVR